MKLTGSAWVTGAGKGIGRALSLRLAARGWKVAVSSRTEQDLMTLVLEASGLPGTIVRVVNPGFVDTPLTQKNNFLMPFIITADAAADIILRGLDKGHFEIAFPWQMAITMKLFRILPYRVALLHGYGYALAFGREEAVEGGS